jgi:hypothetical protein
MPLTSFTIFCPNYSYHFNFFLYWTCMFLYMFVFYGWIYRFGWMCAGRTFCMCVCVCVGRVSGMCQGYTRITDFSWVCVRVMCPRYVSYVCHLRQRRPEETPDHLTHCLDNTYPILYLVYRPCFVCRASNCVSNSLLYGLHTFWNVCEAVVVLIELSEQFVTTEM